MHEKGHSAGASAISFRQLKLYESIGRLQSVRRASEDCNLSQPAVTQSLAKLEQLVGTVLVERRASGSYLNDAGETFYHRVKRFFDLFEEALEQLSVLNAKAITTRLLRSQVRALIAVVESGSFPSAAAALGLSPASLQRAARDLEGNLRKPLYYRTAAGMNVTPDGIDFGRRMKLALQEIDWGIRELGEVEGGAMGPIVVGAMPLGGSVLLGPVLESIIERHPEVEITVRNESALEMLKSLRNGDVDMVVGLVPLTPDEELGSEALVDTPYSIVVRRGHPLLKQGKVTRDDLLGYDWIIGGPGSSRRACFEALFAGGSRGRAPIATSALSVIRHLLTRGDRLTLMTSYELLHQEAGLVAVPYAPIRPVPSIGITTRANWMPTRLHTDFMQAIRERMANAPTDAALVRAC
jgi:LysR family transcriptional regulator, regulator for genes of the gallate degradation pathway